MTDNTNRIEAAKDLLKRIEEVDHNYCDQLEELEARWFACESGLVFESYGRSKYSVDTNVLKVSGTEPSQRTAYQDHLIPAVVRSRDALKAARPEGWDFALPSISRSGKYFAMLTLDDFRQLKTVCSPNINYLPTEELAEFHAIVQAWIYVWENE